VVGWVAGFQYCSLPFESFVLLTSAGVHIYNSFSIWTPLGWINIIQLSSPVRWRDLKLFPLLSSSGLCSCMTTAMSKSRIRSIMRDRKWFIFFVLHWWVKFDNNLRCKCSC
jgi:hypothetical protein